MNSVCLSGTLGKEVQIVEIQDGVRVLKLLGRALISSIGLMLFVTKKLRNTLQRILNKMIM